jgi:Fe-S cluster assembly ATPase SufC
LQKLDSADNSLIVITHYFTILDYIAIDYAYLLNKGEVTKKGTMSLVEEIKEN